jgi:hypothetical protein
LTMGSQVADGGEVVSSTRRPSFNPRKIFWCSFLIEAESTPGLERLGQFTNCNDLIWTRARDLRALSIVPQITTLLRAPHLLLLLRLNERGLE